MIKAKVCAAAAVAALLPALAPADVLQLSNGDRLTGTIEKIHNGKVTMLTALAGRVEVDQAQVSAMTTDAPVNVALADGRKESGRLARGNGGQTELETPVSRLALGPNPILAVWPEGVADPTLPPGNKWTYSLAAGLNGKTGNSEAVALDGLADATLAGPSLTLKFYGRGNYSRTDGVESENSLLGGVDYERIFREIHSWYVRDEAMQDQVRQVRLRNTAASGYGYYFFHDPDSLVLRLRGGLAHVYERQGGDHPQDLSSVSLDFGLHFMKKFEKGVVWTTDLSYQPSFEDYNRYYFFHETTLGIPFFTENATLETGVNNQYISPPADGKKPLDTMYFTRLKFVW